MTSIDNVMLIVLLIIHQLFATFLWLITLAGLPKISFVARYHSCRQTVWRQWGIKRTPRTGISLNFVYEVRCARTIILDVAFRVTLSLCWWTVPADRSQCSEWKLYGDSEMFKSYLFEKNICYINVDWRLIIKQFELDEANSDGDSFYSSFLLNWS